jgi:hypothetical protein
MTDPKYLQNIIDALEELVEAASSTAQSGDTAGLSEAVSTARAALRVTPLRVGSLHVSLYNGHLENIEFQQTLDLSPGTYDLYTITDS